MRLIVLALAVYLSGCATVMNGKRQEVGIASTPGSADVIIDGAPSGKTPMFISLDRSDTHTIIVQKDGHQSSETVISRRVSGWVWGNLLLLPLAPVGLVVDLISGSAYKLTVEDVKAELPPVAH